MISAYLSFSEYELGRDSGVCNSYLLVNGSCPLLSNDWWEGQLTLYQRTNLGRS